MEPNLPEDDLAAITRKEKMALLVFFLIALVYAGVQIYLRNQTSVDLGDDINLPVPGVVVQVEGAVGAPGMVSLLEGAIVMEAIEAAGGFLPTADRGAVDIARVLEDGERVFIPYLDESGTQNGGNGEPDLTLRRVPPSGPDDDEGDSTRHGPVNINTASKSQLKSLPGIGEELASRIIEYRNTHGPFQSIGDLTKVEGIGEGRLGEIRHLITVGN